MPPVGLLALSSEVIMLVTVGVSILNQMDHGCETRWQFLREFLLQLQDVQNTVEEMQLNKTWVEFGTQLFNFRTWVTAFPAFFSGL